MYCYRLSSPNVIMNNRKIVRTKPTDETTQPQAFAPLQSLFAGFELEDKGGYITQEFQDFGYRLAIELEDLDHKSLYIRLAKKEDRGILERALSFVSDAASARSKARLFMWKVQQLKKEKTERKK